jgi:hypothetical protein
VGKHHLLVRWCYVIVQHADATAIVKCTIIDFSMELYSVTDHDCTFSVEDNSRLLVSR